MGNHPDIINSSIKTRRSDCKVAKERKHIKPIQPNKSTRHIFYYVVSKFGHISSADTYVSECRDQFVMVDFEERRTTKPLRKSS